MAEVISNKEFCVKYKQALAFGWTYQQLAASLGINEAEMFRIKAGVNHILRSAERPTLPLLKHEDRDSWKLALV